MKTLLQIMRLPSGTEEKYARAHQGWIALALTGLGCCIGLLSLMFSAAAVESLVGLELFLSYLADPLILFLNLWPPVLLVWLFYFLFRRAWVGFLGGFIPIIGIALVNYFKIRLRADPFLAVDLGLASEAAGIVGKYQLELSWLIWLTAAALVAGLVFSIVLMPRGLRGWPLRLFGAMSSASMLFDTSIAKITSTPFVRLSSHLYPYCGRANAIMRAATPSKNAAFFSADFTGLRVLERSGSSFADTNFERLLFLFRADSQYTAKIAGMASAAAYSQIGDSKFMAKFYNGCLRAPTLAPAPQAPPRQSIGTALCTM